MSECSFVGFTVRDKKIRWTDKALANFKHRVRQLTGRSWGAKAGHKQSCGLFVPGEESGRRPDAPCKGRWNTGCTGWGNTCGAGRRTSASASITVRSSNWTTGSGGVSACATGNSGAGCARRSRIKNLLALGVSLKTAIQHGVSSKR